MTVVILALFGILVGVGLVWLPFPLNLAFPITTVAVILALVSPLWLVVALLGVTPFRLLWARGGISPAELCYSFVFLWLLSVSLLRHLLRPFGEKSSLGSSPVLLPVVCMAGIGAWGTLLAVLRGHPFLHWSSDLNFILFFWLYFVVTIDLEESRHLYRIFWPVAWLTVVAVIWGAVWRIRAGGVYTGFYPGFPRAMAFSSTLFILSVCLFLFAPPPSPRRKWFLLLSCFFGLHQFLSFVRVTWIAQIASAGFILLALPFSEKRRFFKVFGIVFLIVSALLTVSWVAPTENRFVKTPVYVMDRFLSIFTDVTGSGATMRTRYSEWEAALKRVAEHPVLGHGLGTEIEFVRYDYERRPVSRLRYIHSSYIYYLLNMGVMGLLVFLWFCFASIRFGLRLYRRLPPSELKGWALGLSASLFFQIVASTASNELNNPSRTIWTGFFLGTLAAIDRLTRDQHPL